MDGKIKKMNIADLIPDDKNFNMGSEFGKQLLDKSFGKFGAGRSILLDKNNRIIAGNKASESYGELGGEDVLVIETDGKTLVAVKRVDIDLDTKEGRELAAADNATQKADLVWDQKMLKAVSEEYGLNMAEWGIMEWSKEDDEEAEAKEDDFDEQKDKVEQRCFKGDLWKLGEHRLMCGDSTSVDDLDKLMQGEKSVAVVSNPPYNTGMTGKSNHSARLSGMFNDSYTDEEWEKFMADFCSSFDYVMQTNSVAYISLDWRRDYQLIPHLKRHFALSNIIIWDKVVHGLGSDYKYTYEVINVCKKGKPTLNTHQGDKEYQDVWHIQRKVGRDEDHATKKPIELFARCIRHCSNGGDVIVDLFGGSGTTLLACEQLNRKCRMMELDPHYCDVIIARWEKLTGRKATRLE